MKFKILFLSISVLAMVFSIIGISLAEVKISDMPTPEKIRNFIPKPLTELFRSFNNIEVDFSKLLFLNRVIEAVPKSAEELGNGFQRLVNGLKDVNNWIRDHIGLDIVFLIKKTGEFFVWAFESIANLIKIGLLLIK